MKGFIILAVTCLIASAWAKEHELTDEEKAKVKEYREECIKQENLSEEEQKKLQDKDYENPTQNLKCYGTCFFEKVGVLKDGVMQEDVIVEKLSPFYGEEETKTAVDKCKNVKGDDRCDTGHKIYQCFVENA